MTYVRTIVQAVAVIVLCAGIASAQSKTAITITPSSATIEVGKTLQLAAKDSIGRTVTAQWSSSAPGVASITGSGLVSALSAGKATIKAKSGRYSASATISVTVPTTTTTSTTTTTVDPSWVRIYPGDSIQTLVNLYPAGTTFYLKMGVHRRQQVRPKDDQRFIGEAGAVMDGENAVAHAFETLGGIVRRVTIKGLVIRYYASGSGQGAIQGDNGTQWIVEDNQIHNNQSIGMRVGPGWLVRRNKVYRNALIGISGYRADAALIENNVVYENAQIADAGLTAQASGMKFLRSTNLVVRSNRVYQNRAKGIWIDGNYRTTLIEGNTVSWNAHEGIWIEKSYGGIIRNNLSEYNGPQTGASWLTRAGIQVSNTPDVEVYGNTVRGNANGITGLHVGGLPTDLNLRNLIVRDNVVYMQIGRTGIAQNASDRRVYTEWNNRFERNKYYLGTNSQYFWWMDASLNETQWRSYGQDIGGTFTR